MENYPLANEHITSVLNNCIITDIITDDKLPVIKTFLENYSQSELV